MLPVSASVCVIYIWHNVCTAPRRRLDRKIWCHWPTVLCVKWGTGWVPHTHLSPDLHSLTCMYLWSVGPTSLILLWILEVWRKVCSIQTKGIWPQEWGDNTVWLKESKMLDKLTMEFHLTLQFIQYFYISHSYGQAIRILLNSYWRAKTYLTRSQ